MRTIEQIEAELHAAQMRVSELETERHELQLSTCPIKVGMIVKRSDEWRQNVSDAQYLVTKLRAWNPGLASVYGRKKKKNGAFELRAVYIAHSDHIEVIKGD